jgi:23S rRNA (adenine2030-N6)-methyltransferase
MNYRHAYHAGNFADVLKHVVLALVIEHLKLKDAPFRVIDTHAGPGLYDLLGGEAQKTGEWREGVGRLIGPDAAPLPVEAAAILAPWLAVVRAENADGGGSIQRYPGSPLVARRLMRAQDRLIANELHPEDGAGLKGLFARDPQVKVLGLDGWVALRSLLPPKERRGVVLIDPPYEQKGELERLAHGLGDALRRFASGTFLLWYPIKDEGHVRALHRAVAALEPGKALAIDLLIRAPQRAGVLNGCGLVAVNPPWTLQERLASLLPVLSARLAQGPGERFRLAPIAANTQVPS